MNDRLITAIDIGTSKVAVAVGEITSGRIRVIGYSEKPSDGVKYGEIRNPLKAAKSIEPALREVKEQIMNESIVGGYSIKDVYVNISGQNIRCLPEHLRRERPDPDEPISEEETDSMLKEMYRYDAGPQKEVILVVPQCYNVDVHMGETDPVGMDGKILEGEYRLFTNNSQAVKHCKDVLNLLGLHANGMIFTPTASAEALLTEDEKELGSILVDIGAGTTDVLIYYKNIVRYATVIPFGGDSITEDINQTCGIAMRSAEQLKIQCGMCISEFAPESRLIIKTNNGMTVKEVSSRLLSSAIEARVCEILATVRHIMEISGYRGKLLGKVVLTGGSSYLNLIQLLAKNILKMDVRISLPDSHTVLGTSVEKVFRPQASTVTGLLLEGMRLQESMPGSLSADTAGKNDNTPEPSTQESTPFKETLFTDEETGPVMQQPDNSQKNVRAQQKPSKDRRGIKGLIKDLFPISDNDNDA